MKNDPDIIRWSQIKRFFVQGQMPGIPATRVLIIAGLLKYCKSMEIFGWDQYQDKKPGELGYWELFAASQLHPFLDPTKRLFDRNLGSSARPVRNDFTERMLYSWYYVYRFDSLPQIKYHGFLKDFGRHKNLIKNFERIIYQ